MVTAAHTPEGFVRRSWTSAEVEGQQRERTLQLQDARRELRAQARTRHAAVVATAPAGLVADIVDLHTPTDGSPRDGEEDVTCRGCPDSYDGRAPWPCQTFSLIERSVL